MANLLNLLNAIFPCLPIGMVDREVQLPAQTNKHQFFYEKTAYQRFIDNDEKPRISSDEAASSIVSAMLHAEKPGAPLDTTIQSLVHQAGGWSEYLATKVLEALEALLKAGKQLGPVMQKAYNKACKEAKDIEGFAADHPIATAVFCTVIALGILVVLAPYALELLGFAARGPVGGKFSSPKAT
ncbi:MAG: hypothetical protein M1836_005722 [Candelina mexicana]|nr:MAG: hypothetical protein M1836_005722 [Candelina mexicana]